MAKKFILLALAAVSAAMFALPAVASAGEWKLDPETSFPVSFNLANAPGTTTTLTIVGTSLKVTCTSTMGTGKQVSATTSEEVTLSFSGCTENLFGSKCTSSGQPTGSIKTTDLTGHNSFLRQIRRPAASC